jgi:hypothetical protein
MTHDTFYPAGDQVAAYVFGLSVGLVRAGHTVHALVAPRDGEPQEQVVDGVQIHRAAWMDPRTLLTRKTDILLSLHEVSRELVDEIRLAYNRFFDFFDIDLVHVHDLQRFAPEFPLALRESRNRRSMPGFLTLHRLRGEQHFADYLQYGQWDGVMAANAEAATEAVALGLEENQIVLASAVPASAEDASADGADSICQGGVVEVVLEQYRAAMALLAAEAQ